MRDSVILFLEDAIQTCIFVRSLSNFIHKSTIMRGRILFLLMFVHRVKVKVTFGTLSLKDCGYDTDFSFVPNHFETTQIGCLCR